MGQTIYKAARDIVGDDAHLHHQMGLFEMNRPNGSLLESAKLLNKATELAPYDQSIRHSIAEHRLRTALERAFEANPRNSLIALRLSRMYEEQGSLDKSRAALEKALAANANEQRLHYAYAKILLKIAK